MLLKLSLIHTFNLYTCILHHIELICGSRIVDTAAHLLSKVMVYILHSNTVSWWSYYLKGELMCPHGTIFFNTCHTPEMWSFVVTLRQHAFVFRQGDQVHRLAAL